MGLRLFGLQEERAEFSKPSTWYVLFSIMCQQALTAAVFIGIGDSSGGGGSFEGPEGWMAAMMVVVGALTTSACVAVAAMPVGWLARKRRPVMGGTDESLLDVVDTDVESKTPSAGAVGSTLETPLLQ